jgi:FkbM family methyltransferase
MNGLRSWVVRKVRGTPLESLAFETDERACQARGLLRGTFSQHNEDRIVMDYMGGKPGVYVDVGANYPVKISNTYLLYRNGWTGLTIEPIPRLSRRHRRLRPRDVHVNAAVGPDAQKLKFYELDDSVLSTFDAERMRRAVAGGSKLKAEHSIDVVPLRELIAKHLGDRQIDLLTIDTEGFDLGVLRSNDWGRYRPRLVIFEEDDGATAGLARAHLAEQGYKPFAMAGCNVIMERGD